MVWTPLTPDDFEEVSQVVGNQMLSASADAVLGVLGMLLLLVEGKRRSEVHVYSVSVYIAKSSDSS